MDEIYKAIEKNRKIIFDAEKFVWEHPETGYKEYKTTEYLAHAFEKLGYQITYPTGITGFYTIADTGRPGPQILVLGEADSVICTSHPSANQNTGAVHACGHHIQVATLLGMAAALKEKEVIASLCGKIMLCVVPAEELLELDYRADLTKQNKIKYMNGKTEFLHRGYFDNVDIAFMVHASTQFCVDDGTVGSITKKVIYKGRSSHAGGAPWDGKNSLYAATCGLNAVNAIRETFKDTDQVRVHPIITACGDTANTIPETTVLDSYVRGKSFEAITTANKKVNQALIGAALSLDCNVEIIDTPGYSPLNNDKNLKQIFIEAYEQISPPMPLYIRNEKSSGSTDMGDLSCIMPTMHAYAGGACGETHGSDYRIIDKESACIKNAEWQLLVLWLLLKDNAKRANKIINDFVPQFSSKAEYLTFIDSLNNSGTRINYKNSLAEINLQ